MIHLVNSNTKKVHHHHTHHHHHHHHVNSPHTTTTTTSKIATSSGTSTALTTSTTIGGGGERKKMVVVTPSSLHYNDDDETYVDDNNTHRDSSPLLPLHTSTTPTSKQQHSIFSSCSSSYINNSNNNNNNNNSSNSGNNSGSNKLFSSLSSHILLVISVMLLLCLTILLTLLSLIYRFYFVTPYQFNSDLTLPYDNYFQYVSRKEQRQQMQRISSSSLQSSSSSSSILTSTTSTSSTSLLSMPHYAMSLLDNQHVQHSFGNFLQSPSSMSSSLKTLQNAQKKQQDHSSTTSTSSLEYKLNQLKTSNNEIIVTIATQSFKNLLFNWLCSLSAVRYQSTTIEPPLNHLLIYTIDAQFGRELIDKYHIDPIHVYVDEAIATQQQQQQQQEQHENEQQRSIEQQQQQQQFNNGSSSSSSSNTLPSSSSSSDGLKYDTRDYQVLMVHRTRFIRKLLLEMNYRILLVDSDSIWFHSPLDYIHSQQQYSNVDLIAQNDEPSAKVPVRTIICGGFLYLNNTRNMKKYWNIVTERHSHQILNNISVQTEQDLLNQYRNYLTVRYLPMEHYPSGAVYFGAHGHVQRNFPQVHVVHNNWVIGKKNKMKRFYSFRGFLWLLDDEAWKESQALKCKFTREEAATEKASAEAAPLITKPIKYV